MSNLDTLPPIATACAITAVAMYPVDVARALKMASATGPVKYTMGEFVKTHGIKGTLSQGVAPEVARATWMRVLKFFFFPITHEAMWGKPTSKGTPLEKGLAGAIAVIPEVATITTLELAKIGLQLDKEKKYSNSAVALIKDVWKRGGFVGSMAGWQGVQARQMLWTGESAGASWVSGRCGSCCILSWFCSPLSRSPLVSPSLSARLPFLSTLLPRLLPPGTYFASLDAFKVVAKKVYSGDKAKPTAFDNGVVNFLVSPAQSLAYSYASPPPPLTPPSSSPILCPRPPQAGFAAGIAGAAANTPFDVVRTNIQKEALSGASKDSPARLAWSFGKMASVAKDITAAKGVGALYSGFGFKALHMGGSGAFVAMLIPVCAKMFGVDKPIM